MVRFGFPTAFTLMGMGMLFTFLAYARAPGFGAAPWELTLQLMVQRAFGVMTHDVLISIPLFVFMGYLVERASLVEKLFRSLQLALARIPGSLAVATLLTCAVFATATGIVGAVVTLMGLLAYPAMLRAGYDARLGAGAIAAGGCLGILIPPSVMLIVYGATAGVSVVKLYAGAFFPGLMLAGLYVLYVMVLAGFRPALAPALPEAERNVPVPALNHSVRGLYGNNALMALLRASLRPSTLARGKVVAELALTLLPAIACLLVLSLLLGHAHGPRATQEVPPTVLELSADNDQPGPMSDDALQPPPLDSPSAPIGLPETAAPGVSPQNALIAAPAWSVVIATLAGMGLSVLYMTMNFERLEIFKMLLSSFFPLALLIVAVLGTIVFGLATPTEAAAVGALGGALLAAAYGRLSFAVVKDSVFLTAKTSAMVCWLFVGSAIFSAAFALLGGQALVERFVLGMDLSPVQFMLLAQLIIFVLGWPLEWTEIIVIFMPIFIPLLGHFGIDPLFFGLLVALNLQTAFLSPPVAMAAFYLKGVAPAHVSLNQIFAGMLPFMAIQIVALGLLYRFPDIGLWLPRIVYGP